MRSFSAVSCYAVACLLLLTLAVPAQSAVIHVKPDGDDSKTGLTWESAMKTVQSALAAAKSGDEIWVAAGTYTGNFKIKPGVGLYGGFRGDESHIGNRDRHKNKTVLQGQTKSAVVSIYSPADNTTVVDGFTICNPKSYDSWDMGFPAGGIYCDNSSPVIRNNLITRNYVQRGGGIVCVGRSYARIENNIIKGNWAKTQGGGIYCSGTGLPIITGNVIIDNTAESNGGGIACFGGTAEITGNLICCNRADPLSSHAGAGGGGIYCASDARPLIRRNRIIGNTAVYCSGGGILCFSSAPTIEQNTIYGNLANYTLYSPTGDPDGSVGGGGICCVGGSLPRISCNQFAANAAQYGGTILADGSSPSIVNNTITYGKGRMGGGGLFLRNNSSPRVISNIIAFGSSGILVSGGSPVLRRNCFYGNREYDYSGIQRGEGDIHSDPGFAGPACGDFHIQPGSPCIDSGDDSAVIDLQIAEDTDGQSRLMGDHVDIGADESDGTVWDVNPVRIYVDQSVTTSGDGTTWQEALKSISEAITAAALTGSAQIWVADGVYNEQVTLLPFISIYGGFAGDETSIDQRDCRKNQSIIDGGGYMNYPRGGSSIVVKAAELSVIDGFVIRNGQTGVYSWYVTPVIRNNVILRNNEGISCVGSSASIFNNTFSGNCWDGIFCEYASPVIEGNRFSGDDFAISAWDSSVVIRNNIITAGTIGIMLLRCPSAELVNNTIAGNGTDCKGIEPGVDDISVDPLFVGLDYGDVHIQPESLCVDAGDDSAVIGGSVDYDREPRIQGIRVDIGADESDGCIQR